MNYRIPGIASVVFLSVSFVIAFIHLLSFSVGLAVGYLVSIPLAFLNLLRIYCRRCPHVLDDSCRHVVFGRLVKRLFGPSEPRPYSAFELVLGLLPLCAVVVFPQFWLVRNGIMLAGFWISTAVAVAIVFTRVCPGCRNTLCIFCPNR